MILEKVFMKRIISSMLMCVVLFFCVVCGIGCDNAKEIPYNATIIAYRDDVNEDFLYKKENMIDYAYINRDYKPGDPLSEKYITTDSNLPPYRLIQVNEQMFSKELLKNAPNIDFETKMVFIAIFTVFGSYSYGLKNVQLNNDIIEITLKVRCYGSTTDPVLVCTVILLDRLDFKDSKLCFSE